MAVTRIFTWTPTTETGFLNTELDNIIAALNAVAAGSTDIAAYAKLAGRVGGQALNGDTASGGNLTLVSTAHVTKGKLLFGTSGYDEVNNRLGIGHTVPAGSVHAKITADAESLLRAEATSAVGTSSRSTINALADTANCNVVAHGTARTVTRCGITLGGWSELLALAGSGLIVSTNNSTPVVFGTNNVERVRIDASATKVGIGQVAPATALHVGANAGLGAVTLDKEASTPANPASSAECRVYHKGSLIVFQYNDAGTVRYKSLDLSGTGVTWVHATVAP